ncbi:NOC3-like protein [Aphelenchoides bicaudatus]|nr:NOC3-like protein [Aphelenchoides bicaudatus]
MGKFKKKPLFTGRQKFKAEKRIHALAKKGRINQETKNRFIDFKNRRGAGSIDLANRINKDWLEDRQFVEDNEEYEDMIPLDMLSDRERKKPTLVGRKRKHEEQSSDEEESDSEELRRFKEELGDDEKELLPFKIDGSLIRRIEKFDNTEIKEEEVDDEEESETEEIDNDPTKEDLSDLSPIDRLVREKEILAETENHIHSQVKALQVDPQNEINRLGDLIKLASGQRVHPTAREEAQLLATSNVTQIFIDIIPGYAIRELSEDEKGQKMKKETRQLIAFEDHLLMHYSNFLKLLEKYGKKLVKPKASMVRENTFTTKIGMLSAECLGKLMSNVAHFNFASNLVTYFVNFAVTAYEPLLDIVVEALSDLFKSDVTLRNSLHGVKAIAALVSNKQSKVPPRLLGTFLSLNIRNVDRRNTENEKDALTSKKHKLHKERKTKSVKKFDKQLKKVEADLKEVEAAERMSTKLKLSTEIMKHVFATYFRILRKMSDTTLISPVLSGLSKFAHLINIDFFDDLVNSFEDLIEKKQLKTTDALMCIRTVCIILSGEGKALNIDPFKFYKELYRLLPAIPFQKNPDKQAKEVKLLCECMDFMINQRKKLIPFPRVIAFVKRLLLIGFMLPPKQVISILATIRTHFLAHPKLASYVDDEDDLVANGIFKPDLPDPDYCNASSANFVAELKKYEKYPNPVVATYAKHIRANIPSTGHEKLKPEWCTRKPVDWLRDETIKDIDSPYLDSVTKFAKKRKCLVSAAEIGSILTAWISV